MIPMFFIEGVRFKDGLRSIAGNAPEGISWRIAELAWPIPFPSNPWRDADQLFLPFASQRERGTLLALRAIWCSGPIKFTELS
jgi:hypothetical protein